MVKKRRKMSSPVIKTVSKQDITPVPRRVFLNAVIRVTPHEVVCLTHTVLGRFLVLLPSVSISSVYDFTLKPKEKVQEVDILTPGKNKCLPDLKRNVGLMVFEGWKGSVLSCPFTD